ncbi:DNA polymerase-3 subunit epsilon [Flavobacterium fryxellicola]|uniref:Exonuclease n=1 Tax=Flavobacterium fryxellicola TaxID=249352 RepID=A0A167U6X6_9FLAO|nr:exonuclease domain-containing protein [Flavobacterium fryxellicola]OAB25315.1 exonuclease [Flavobacterium fryxellicola]SHN75182.1 DNA polymerase-3 subunit epsilon [Flavobacterium fryxellicola]
MKNFTAIDFETATGYRNSICQIGLVQVKNGIIINEINILVQPPDNYYWNRFTDIHGIAAIDTKTAPTFDHIWHKIVPFIDNQNLIAHNGFGFDFPVLKKTLQHYNLPTPSYNKFCNYKIYKTNLANLCNENKIALNHHDALSDARACAKLYLKYVNKI